MDARKILPAAVAVLAIALAAPAGASAKVVWLCKPGMRANPCEPSLTTTVYSPAGKELRVEHVRRAKHRRAGCFFVFPPPPGPPRAPAAQGVGGGLPPVLLPPNAR